MHYCSQCGQEISRREKFCQRCGTRVEYLCALPPVPASPDKRRELRRAPSITKWIIGYVVLTLLIFMFSYAYFSTPGLQFWHTSEKSVSPGVPAVQSPPVARVENPAVALKSSYNQLSVGLQKTVALVEEARKVNVAGDPKRTATNYRAVQRSADALIGQLSMPPDVSSDAAAVAAPLKECVALIGKSSTIMADYLDGKLSLAPPNPDWVGRSQEYSAQAQARLKEAQQALTALRKKID